MMQAHNAIYGDTRSLATKRQQELFQRLGTLHRTKHGLERAIYGSTSKLRCAVYRRALQAVALDIADVRHAMTQLPSKKNLKLRGQNEPCKPAPI